jgi:N-acetylmuramic acid 6-phosphate etherase
MTASLPKARRGARTAAWLGVECGGTRTVILLVPTAGGTYERAELGPANLRLLDQAGLLRHFKAIRAAVQAAPAGIVIGMAGARTRGDRQRILAAAAKVWPATPCHATNDLETALMAVQPATGLRGSTRVLILSGTGSCCFGRRADGKTARVGGWGHLLGDNGSGYQIGLRALRTVLGELDRRSRWPALGADILGALQWNEPDDLIAWANHAEKAEVAALATTVFAAAARGDRIAREILDAAAAALARDGAACARRLVKAGAPVEFVFSGSVLLRQKGFARKVGARLRSLWPGARITPLRQESAWGAIELAKERFGEGGPGGGQRRGILAEMAASADSPPPYATPTSRTLPPTERRNPRSRNLDRLLLGKAVALMIREEGRVAAAIFKERRKIERAVVMIADSLGRGGRLFYVGAGTSGRLGVLDAAECPPTFRLPPGRVQGIMAGGRTAIWRSVEGAEDDALAGTAAIAHRGVRRGDVVAGIAASGRTPFVRGALRAAGERGARTILLCFNPRLEIAPGDRPDLVIAPDTGPELLTGSTRLKAGTATKVILNTFTTLAMARLGKVRGNLMVDVAATNQKLRDRAVRMVRALTGADAAAARAALEKHKWSVRLAAGETSR